MDDLHQYIMQYTVYKRRNDAKDANPTQTHTFFGCEKSKKIKTLCIPHDKMTDFWRAYIAYCIKMSDDVLCASGWNAISEKVGDVFPFFVDLEFKIDDFCSGRVDHRNVAPVMVETREIFQQVLQEAFGERFECISAYRMIYKCHLYFPDVLVTKNQANSLCEDVRSRLYAKYPWLEDVAFVDSSVYNSGLRMLYSHKGNCEKNADREKHVAYFDGKMPYESYYQLGAIASNGDESRIVYVKNQRNVDVLRRCSILCGLNAAPHSFRDDYRPVVVSTKKSKIQSTTASTKRKHVTNDVRDVNDVDDVGAPDVEHADELPPTVMFLIREYLKEELPVLGLRPEIESIKVNKYGSVLAILTPQSCPFVGREHRRTSDKGVSALYVVLNGFDRSIRCFDEGCTDTLALGNPKRELLDHLQTYTKDYALKRSLYKQTHEAVAQYIFGLIKDEYATSAATQGQYVWYFYDQQKHKWVERETLLTTITEETALIHASYQDYIRRVKNDGNMNEQDVKIIGELWKKLEISLETVGFVRGGVLPILARKLEQHWAIIIERKKGRCVSFQSALDDDPKLIGCTNGVWDLRAGVFRNGRADDFISMSTNLPYTPFSSIDENRKQELFDFLRKIYPIEQHLDYVLGEIASCLDGTPNHQRFFLMTGKGANGKSTFDRLIHLAFGEYAGMVNIVMFVKPPAPSHQASPDKMSLKGLRFVSCSEPNAREPLRLDVIKRMTGGDPVRGRQIYEKEQSFMLQCTFFCYTNDIPPIHASANEYAVWRRLRPVEHYSRFVPEPNPNKPYEHAIDLDIDTKMHRWKDVLLSYLVHAFVNRLPYAIPEEFKTSLRKLQGNSDHYARFVNEYLVKDENKFLSDLAVFEAFSGWLRLLKNTRRDVPFDTFKEHMVSLLGPTVIGRDHRDEEHEGWNVEQKKGVPSATYY